MKIHTKAINQFRETVWAYYHAHERKLPWRETRDPYRILVSEVMLQQTQVTRVLVKYPLFIGVYPDFSSLSQTSTSELLSVWSGMGYNRRALYLKRIAEIVIKDHDGRLPTDVLTLDSLPGIGRATACAIITYIYNQPLVFIETNIRRVYIHHFFKDRDDIGDEELAPFVAATVEQENPREWYYALMDYGTHLAKTVQNPNRRSRHYTVQSKFEGSDRQIRGKIIRFLLEKPMSENELITELGDNEDRIRRIIKGMAVDGFITGVNGVYMIE